MDGGSWALLTVLRDYRGAVEYDFRTKFHRGLRIIGEDMSLAEAARHVKRWLADPSSAVGAEVGSLEHPVSRELLVLMDIWDLEAAKSGAKRPPIYPRPWKQATQTKTRGDAAGRTPDQVKAMLKEQFGQPEAPV